MIIYLYSYRCWRACWWVPKGWVPGPGPLWPGRQRERRSRCRPADPERGWARPWRSTPAPGCPGTSAPARSVRLEGMKFIITVRDLNAKII